MSDIFTNAGIQAVRAARASAVAIGTALLVAVASPAAADKAADLAAGRDAVGRSLSQYMTVAGAANGLNQAYAAYQWGQPFRPATPAEAAKLAVSKLPGMPGKGGGAAAMVGGWLRDGIDSADAETLLKAANTRCGKESAGSVAQIAGQMSQLVSPQAASSYTQARGVMCQALDVAAQLAYRYNQYQSLKANGYTLKSFQKTQKFEFPGDRERHASFRGEFKWYPDAQDTVANGFNVEDRLAYVSDFKWSDDNWRNLNVIKKLRESMGGNEDMICIPFTSWAAGCFNILNYSASSVTIDTYANFRVTVGGYRRDKTLRLGAITVPAPFGYLDQVAQMKEKAKQDLMAQATARLADMLKIDQQTVQLVQALAARAAAP